MSLAQIPTQTAGRSDTPTASLPWSKKPPETTYNDLLENKSFSPSLDDRAAIENKKEHFPGFFERDLKPFKRKPDYFGALTYIDMVCASSLMTAQFFDQKIIVHEVERLIMPAIKDLLAARKFIDVDDFIGKVLASSLTKPIVVDNGKTKTTIPPFIDGEVISGLRSKISEARDFFPRMDKYKSDLPSEPTQNLIQCLKIELELLNLLFAEKLITDQIGFLPQEGLNWKNVQVTLRELLTNIYKGANAAGQWQLLKYVVKEGTLLQKVLGQGNRWKFDLTIAKEFLNDLCSTWEAIIAGPCPAGAPALTAGSASVADSKAEQKQSIAAAKRNGSPVPEVKIDDTLLREIKEAADLVTGAPDEKNIDFAKVLTVLSRELKARLSFLVEDEAAQQVKVVIGSLLDVSGAAISSERIVKAIKKLIQLHYRHAEVDKSQILGYVDDRDTLLRALFKKSGIKAFEFLKELDENYKGQTRRKESPTSSASGSDSSEDESKVTSPAPAVARPQTDAVETKGAPRVAVDIKYGRKSATEASTDGTITMTLGLTSSPLSNSDKRRIVTKYAQNPDTLFGQLVKLTKSENEAQVFGANLATIGEAKRPAAMRKKAPRPLAPFDPDQVSVDNLSEPASRADSPVVGPAASHSPDLLAPLHVYAPPMFSSSHSHRPQAARSERKETKGTQAHSLRELYERHRGHIVSEAKIECDYFATKLNQYLIQFKKTNPIQPNQKAQFYSHLEVLGYYYTQRLCIVWEKFIGSYTGVVVPKTTVLRFICNAIKGFEELCRRYNITDDQKLSKSPKEKSLPPLKTTSDLCKRIDTEVGKWNKEILDKKEESLTTSKTPGQLEEEALKEHVAKLMGPRKDWVKGSFLTNMFAALEDFNENVIPVQHDLDTLCCSALSHLDLDKNLPYLQSEGSSECYTFASSALARGADASYFPPQLFSQLEQVSSAIEAEEAKAKEASAHSADAKTVDRASAAQPLAEGWRTMLSNPEGLERLKTWAMHVSLLMLEAASHSHKSRKHVQFMEAVIKIREVAMGWLFAWFKSSALEEECCVIVEREGLEKALATLNSRLGLVTVLEQFSQQTNTSFEGMLFTYYRSRPQDLRTLCEELPTKRESITKALTAQQALALVTPQPAVSDEVSAASPDQKSNPLIQALSELVGVVPAASAAKNYDPEHDIWGEWVRKLGIEGVIAHVERIIQFAHFMKGLNTENASQFIGPIKSGDLILIKRYAEQVNTGGPILLQKLIEIVLKEGDKLVPARNKAFEDRIVDRITDLEDVTKKIATKGADGIAQAKAFFDENLKLLLALQRLFYVNKPLFNQLLPGLDARHMSFVNKLRNQRKDIFTAIDSATPYAALESEPELQTFLSLPRNLWIGARQQTDRSDKADRVGGEVVSMPELQGNTLVIVDIPTQVEGIAAVSAEENERLKKLRLDFSSLCERCLPDISLIFLTPWRQDKQKAVKEFASYFVVRPLSDALLAVAPAGIDVLGKMFFDQIMPRILAVADNKTLIDLLPVFAKKGDLYQMKVGRWRPQIDAYHKRITSILAQRRDTQVDPAEKIREWGILLRDLLAANMQEKAASRDIMHVERMSQLEINRVATESKVTYKVEHLLINIRHFLLSELAKEFSALSLLTESDKANLNKVIKALEFVKKVYNYFLQLCASKKREGFTAEHMKDFLNGVKEIWDERSLLHLGKIEGLSTEDIVRLERDEFIQSIDKMIAHGRSLQQAVSASPAVASSEEKAPQDVSQDAMRKAAAIMDRFASGERVSDIEVQFLHLSLLQAAFSKKLVELENKSFRQAREFLSAIAGSPVLMGFLKEVNIDVAKEQKRIAKLRKFQEIVPKLENKLVTQLKGTSDAAYNEALEEVLKGLEDELAEAKLDFLKIRARFNNVELPLVKVSEQNAPSGTKILKVLKDTITYEWGHHCKTHGSNLQKYRTQPVRTRLSILFGGDLQALVAAEQRAGVVEAKELSTVSQSQAAPKPAPKKPQAAGGGILGVLFNARRRSGSAAPAPAATPKAAANGADKKAEVKSKPRTSSVDDTQEIPSWWLVDGKASDASSKDVLIQAKWNAITAIRGMITAGRVPAPVPLAKTAGQQFVKSIEVVIDPLIEAKERLSDSTDATLWPMGLKIKLKEGLAAIWSEEKEKGQYGNLIEAAFALQLTETRKATQPSYVVKTVQLIFETIMTELPQDTELAKKQQLIAYAISRDNLIGKLFLVAGGEELLAEIKKELEKIASAPIAPPKPSPVKKAKTFTAEQIKAAQERAKALPTPDLNARAVVPAEESDADWSAPSSRTSSINGSGRNSPALPLANSSAVSVAESSPALSAATSPVVATQPPLTLPASASAPVNAKQPEEELDEEEKAEREEQKRFAAEQAQAKRDRKQRQNRKNKKGHRKSSTASKGSDIADPVSATATPQSGAPVLAQAFDLAGDEKFEIEISNSPAVSLVAGRKNHAADSKGDDKEAAAVVVAPTPPEAKEALPASARALLNTDVWIAPPAIAATSTETKEESWKDSELSEPVSLSDDVVAQIHEILGQALASLNPEQPIMQRWVVIDFYNQLLQQLKFELFVNLEPIYYEAQGKLVALIEVTFATYGKAMAEGGSSLLPLANAAMLLLQTIMQELAKEVAELSAPHPMSLEAGFEGSDQDVGGSPASGEGDPLASLVGSRKVSSADGGDADVSETQSIASGVSSVSKTSVQELPAVAVSIPASVSVAAVAVVPTPASAQSPVPLPVAAIRASSSSTVVSVPAVAVASVPVQSPAPLPVAASGPNKATNLDDFLGDDFLSTPKHQPSPAFASPLGRGSASMSRGGFSHSTYSRLGQQSGGVAGNSYAVSSAGAALSFSPMSSPAASPRHGAGSEFAVSLSFAASPIPPRHPPVARPAAMTPVASASMPHHDDDVHASVQGFPRSKSHKGVFSQQSLSGPGSAHPTASRSSPATAAGQAQQRTQLQQQQQMQSQQSQQRAVNASGSRTAPPAPRTAPSKRA